MEHVDIASIPNSGKHLVFSDMIKDDLRVENVSLQACQFVRLGAKKATFSNCSLTQCLFEDTYLRMAKFQNVQLVGSTFRHCNLEKASFRGCDIRYCRFEATLLDRNEIIGCLPIEPNLKRATARNLRKNFELLGDKASADIFLNIEIAAEEQELLGAFWRRTEYYRSHYTPTDQFLAGLKYLLSKLSGVVWGYGHRVRRLFFAYFALASIFALVTYFSSLQFRADTGSQHSLGLMDSFYYSFATSLGLTLAQTAPLSLLGKVLQILEGGLGTVFLALLAAAAYRRIAR